MNRMIHFDIKEGSGSLVNFGDELSTAEIK